MDMLTATDDYACMQDVFSLISQFNSYHRGYFAQHHVDSLIPTMSPVQFLASKFPGKSEQEYRQHLGNFQISGMTGYIIFPEFPDTRY
jgi:hypothetical protein